MLTGSNRINRIPPNAKLIGCKRETIVRPIIHYMAYLYLFLALTMPNFLNLYLELRSFSLGYIVGQIAILFFCLLILPGFTRFRPSLSVIVMSILLSTFLLSGIGEYFNSNSVTQTAALVTILLVTIVNVATISNLVREYSFHLVEFVRFSWFLSLAIGSISLLQESRMVFLFGEPSYFALFIGPLTLVLGVLDQKYFSKIVILVAFGVLLPNITIFSYALILMYLMNRYFLPLVLILVFLLYSNYDIPLSNYIFERISLDSREANLSNLQYVLSWQQFIQYVSELRLTADGVGSTYSDIYSYGEYSEALGKKYGYALDFSGGFQALYHLRAVGLFGLSFLGFVLLRCLIYSKRYLLKSRDLDLIVPFAFYLSVLPELLLRSPGILSFGTFLSCFVLIYFEDGKTIPNTWGRIRKV